MTWQPRGVEARVAVLGGQEQISKIHNKIHIKIHKLGGPAYIIYLTLLSTQVQGMQLYAVVRLGRQYKVIIAEQKVRTLVVFTCSAAGGPRAVE